MNDYNKMLESLNARCNATFIKNKLKKGYFEHNSYITPITSEMCRNSKCIHSKAYTSISRIAKG